jgi:ArsR family transcriptional regulator, virulence genes transcriptional regulator
MQTAVLPKSLQSHPTDQYIARGGRGLMPPSANRNTFVQLLMPEKFMDTHVAAGQDAKSSFPEQMLERAAETTLFLKSLSHPARLVVLCKLAEGPSVVSDLSSMLNLPQAEVSKQLARLRSDGMVVTRRDGRNVIYSLSDERTGRVVRLLHAEFCN